MALDVLGEKWTLLVVRELLCGSHRFSEIQRGVPLISKTLLSQRLKTLEEARVIERRKADTGAGYDYHLTAAGEELRPIVEGLGWWGRKHAQRELTREELDPGLLMWDVHRRIDTARIPEQETLVQFWFRDMPAARSRYWLRLDKPEVELCVKNPGLEVGLAVETRCRTFTDIWIGERDLRAALRDGAVELRGPPSLRRAFPDWLLLNLFAPSASAHQR